MNVVTSRPAAPEQDGPSSGPAAGDERRPARAGSVAPQPRAVPVEPAEPTEAPATVEPTTGAPVDAVPRRVPVRQPGRGHWRQPVTGTPGDGDAGWRPIEEVHWDGTPLREEPRRRRSVRDRLAVRRATPRRTHPPDPLPALAALLALSLLATFFAWVSAGPLWLAVGHSTGGTVVIADCTGGGLTQRCRGIFLADGGRFVAHGVRVSGVPAERTGTGTALPARMIRADGGTAYADTGSGRHLRWLLGLLLVLVCGAGIARWTGATRLRDPRRRHWAVGVSLTGPLLITLGFLAAAW
ncbi:hypothetical protein U2F26_03800 [Micromonospora sp. 4G57]|uniref:Uncharacterized protein n=1 Tax=Micromonospora sicca TaxID=2202420 RepID=A0ABU5J9R9_9ACTN|nr:MULTISPECIES: hypothetical protein [unclassified Micromonospora]MDZ5441854.1 hypothetical protein [Micromonospora sp. 4G57]MDZ5489293.1 hypothetical protein [Micromonospora sp. 4G53]